MPVIKNKKIVISGGPGSGKTTLINLLRDRGYICFSEFSRVLINSAQKKGEINIFKSQPDFFSEEVWKGRKQQYINSQLSEGKNQNSFIFFDRGLHDVVAYLECTGVHYDTQKYNLADFRYDMVILLPPWKAIYTKDKERNESFDEAENLYFYIRNTYQKNNIPIVEIPFQCPEVRISTLLKYLDDEKTG